MCEKRVLEGAGCGSEDDNLVMNGDIILILFVLLDNIVYLCTIKRILTKVVVMLFFYTNY